MISAMPTVPASHFVPPVRGWPLGAAVLASVLLHSAAWFWIQPTRVAPRAGGAEKPMRISLHTLPPRPAAPIPAPPLARATPRAQTQAAPPAPRADVRPSPPEIAPPLAAETPPEPPAPAGAATPSNMLYVPAALADQAPVPLGDWVLAEEPWPDGVGAVQITLWIDAEGRIERTLLLGAAADDPRVQALFARIADTPMQPARVGTGDVHSVMTVEIWDETTSGSTVWGTAPADAASGSARTLSNR